MSRLCDTDEIQSLFISTLSDIVIKDMRQFLIHKYSEMTGEFTYDLDVPYNKLQLKATWKRGSLEGPATLVWEDGSIAVEFGYRDFVPHGRATFYDKNKKLCSMSIMDGRYLGDCEFYQMGLLFYAGDYFHGDVNGKGIMYYPNGTFMYEGEFRNGYADGQGTFYSSEGKDIYSDSWKKGKCHVVKANIVLPPMIVAIEQTHDEDVYTEEEFSRRNSNSLIYVNSFHINVDDEKENSIKKRSKTEYGTDTSEITSDSGIPIARGQLTKHMLEQQVVVRTSDEDVMNLPLAGDSKKKTKPTTKKTKDTLSEIEKVEQQPTVLYTQPTECPVPPTVKTTEKIISIYSSDEWKTLSKLVTDLTIETECFNDEYIRYLKFNSFKILQHLTINDYACTTVNTFTIRNNQYLRSLQIGNDCFSTTCVRNASEYNYVLKAIKKDVEGGSFFISLDYYLESIIIGKQSFIKYSRFGLSLLPNLKTLMIGEVSSYDDVNLGSFNFLGVTTLYIEKLPKLKTLVIGSYCFTEVRNVFIQDLPSLKHLELGHSVFRGDETWKQDSIYMKKLPALEELIMRDNVGKKMQYFNLSDVFSSKTLVSLQIGAVFNERIRISHEGCPEDAIQRFLQSVS